MRIKLEHFKRNYVEEDVVLDEAKEREFLVGIYGALPVLPSASLATAEAQCQRLIQYLVQNGASNDTLQPIITKQFRERADERPSLDAIKAYLEHTAFVLSAIENQGDRRIKCASAFNGRFFNQCPPGAAGNAQDAFNSLNQYSTVVAFKRNLIDLEMRRLFMSSDPIDRPTQTALSLIHWGGNAFEIHHVPALQNAVADEYKMLNIGMRDAYTRAATERFTPNQKNTLVAHMDRYFSTPEKAKELIDNFIGDLKQNITSLFKDSAHLTIQDDGKRKFTSAVNFNDFKNDITDLFKQAGYQELLKLNNVEIDLMALLFEQDVMDFNTQQVKGLSKNLNSIIEDYALLYLHGANLIECPQRELNLAKLRLEIISSIDFDTFDKKVVYRDITDKARNLGILKEAIECIASNNITFDANDFSQADITTLINNSGISKLVLLRKAVESGHEQICEAILADDDLLKTAEKRYIFDTLELCAKNGNTKIFTDCILKLGNRCTQDQKNELLNIATDNGHVEIIRLLINNHGCNKNILKNIDHNKAASSGYVGLLQYLVEEKLFSIPNNPSSLIQASATSPSIKTLEFLLSKLAGKKYDEEELLMSMINQNKPLHIKAIIKHSKADKFNYQILKTAVDNNRTQVVTALLSEDREVADYTDNDLQSSDLISVAIQKNNADILKSLTSKGAELTNENIKLAINSNNANILAVISQNNSDAVKKYISNNEINFSDLISNKKMKSVHFILSKINKLEDIKDPQGLIINLLNSDDLDALNIIKTKTDPDNIAVSLIDISGDELCDFISNGKINSAKFIIENSVEDPAYLTGLYLVISESLKSDNKELLELIKKRHADADKLQRFISQVDVSFFIQAGKLNSAKFIIENADNLKDFNQKMPALLESDNKELLELIKTHHKAELLRYLSQVDVSLSTLIQTGKINSIKFIIENATADTISLKNQFNSLMRAALESDNKELLELIKTRHADKLVQVDINLSVLIQAGKINSVKFIIENADNLNNFNQKMPALLESDNKELLELIKTHHADKLERYLLQVDINLSVLIQAGKINSVKFIIENADNLNNFDSKLQALLWLDNQELLELIKTHHESELTKYLERNQFPISELSRNGKLNAVKFILENAKQIQDFDSKLQALLESNNQDIFDLIKTRHADALQRYEAAGSYIDALLLHQKINSVKFIVENCKSIRKCLVELINSNDQELLELIKTHHEAELLRYLSQVDVSLSTLIQAGKINSVKFILENAPTGAQFIQYNLDTIIDELLRSDNEDLLNLFKEKQESSLEFYIETLSTETISSLIREDKLNAVKFIIKNTPEQILGKAIIKALIQSDNQDLLNTLKTEYPDALAGYLSINEINLSDLIKDAKFNAVKFILENIANNSPILKDPLVLSNALHSKNIELLRILEGKGLIIKNATNLNTEFTNAIINRDYDFAQFILDRSDNLDVNSVDGKANTLLTLANRNNAPDILKAELKDRGAIENRSMYLHKTLLGTSALMLAAACYAFKFSTSRNAFLLGLATLASITGYLFIEGDVRNNDKPILSVGLHKDGIKMYIHKGQVEHIFANAKLSYKAIAGTALCATAIAAAICYKTGNVPDISNISATVKKGFDTICASLPKTLLNR